MAKLSVAAYLGALAAVSAATLASAAPSHYLCLPDRSTGFHFDREANAWTQANFAPTEKYILRLLTKDDWAKFPTVILTGGKLKPEWAVFQTGFELPVATCAVEPLFREPKLICHHIIADFEVDRASGRFQIFRSGGYVDQPFWEAQPADAQKQYLADPAKPDDVFVEIGLCTPF